ncbi:UDP-N-acetylglucosamine 4,6-dehydratase (inverting) [Rhodothalassium salexigens]|uniref:UDP-N-acetylglucosamine 4,6-dehydratase (inverting) n=1 Tax=Rhodothalassium salexigens TaxID=1086 RepID=UPI0019134185|nr:UDP-N-acetylglucosamine 4,6-dehydratase (inverting) [Rhodothalassium salexigens]MBK5911756.1 UDP-N-acetylglucosamine 4,6-dehydratase (inverting) [Rhodothalassium salexigens]MBK5920456.1 UDP-N-acetylglucosamine 4,6-dehydratase (inverting) [Rhodothalassium salexigens]
MDAHSRILITGGTGSFGQKLTETLLREHDPERVIIYSRDEFKQLTMQRRFPDPRMRFFIGDVRDRDRLVMAMRNVDVVVHAAALKHVEVAEYNPFEAVRTNIEGAENVVWSAIQAGVRKVVALSTDKAANPINLYGATKLASDKIFIAGNNLAGGAGVRFAVVRYGNVVGSRGSVVPFFKQLAARGTGAIPITDPRMTRFWITLDEGVRFVLACLGDMAGGEIFVPKIPSMAIPDLARAIAPDLPHEVVGIRPGEKLHEVMITAEDSRTTLDMGDYYIIEPTIAKWGYQSRRTATPPAQPVADGFCYASNTNDHWLDVARLKEITASIPAEGDDAV